MHPMVSVLCMKKERRITKAKFSCLFFSAFVWGSRTLGAFLPIE